MDFLINEITPEKVGGNNVDFSTIEITSKKEGKIIKEDKIKSRKHLNAKVIISALEKKQIYSFFLFRRQYFKI